jgi:hypothetical protein
MFPSSPIDVTAREEVRCYFSALRLYYFRPVQRQYGGPEAEILYASCVCAFLLLAIVNKRFNEKETHIGFFCLAESICERLGLCPSRDRMMSNSCFAFFRPLLTVLSGINSSSLSSWALIYGHSSMLLVRIRNHIT